MPHDSHVASFEWMCSQKTGAGLDEVQASMEKLLKGEEPAPQSGHGIILADFLRSASAVFLRILLSRSK